MTGGVAGHLNVYPLLGDIYEPTTLIVMILSHDRVLPLIIEHGIDRSFSHSPLLLSGTRATRSSTSTSLVSFARPGSRSVGRLVVRADASLGILLGLPFDLALWLPDRTGLSVR